MTTYLQNLVNEFQIRDDISVEVIFRHGEDLDNYLIKYNKILFSLKSFHILKKLKPDLILSQGTWFCLYPSVIYKKIYGVKLVHTFHTEPSKKPPLFEKMFMQHLLNGCDYCTFVSKSLQKKNEEICGLKFKNSAIIYAGVNTKEVLEREVNDFYRQFGIPDKKIILTALGLTALRYKADGAKLLIKAVKILSKKYPGITLILTRDGLYSDELKKFAKKEKICDNIIFTGDIEKPYVALEICDIYTHTVLGEGGLSLSILEAMSIGKPILATAAGGIPEAIVNDENGILVDPDVNQIAEKIEYLLKNRDIARKLGENAKKTAEEEFTWKLSADKFLDLYYMEEGYR